MKRLRTFLFVGLAVLAAGASAQITRSGGGYLFRARYTKGQTIRYAMNTTVTMPAAARAQGAPPEVLFSMPIATKVLAVNKGVATLQVKAGPMRNPMMKTAAPATAVRSTTIRVDTRNRPVGGAPSGSVSTPLPAGPVKIGQSWSSTFPIPMGPATGQKASTSYKLLGFRQVAGKRLAVLGITVTGAAQGRGEALLSPADGQAVSVNLTMSMASPGQQPLRMRMSLKRS